MHHVPRRPGAGHFRHHPVSRRVMWAHRSFDGRLGRYVGIALERGEISVAVQAPEGFLRWIAAPEALSEREAMSWATSGFRRAR